MPLFPDKLRKPRQQRHPLELWQDSLSPFVRRATGSGTDERTDDAETFHGFQAEGFPQVGDAKLCHFLL